MDETFGHAEADLKDIVLKALHHRGYKLLRAQVRLEVSPLGSPARVELGIDRGGNDLEHLDSDLRQLQANGHGVGVQAGLACAVYGHSRRGHESQSRRDVDDGRALVL